ncbi:hypothetical protein GA0115259_106866 [Streptomyces sp. MnatMP-M17]|nr:hypothetical protein GA0115259_106866 [Streptomyces sp. MnatMP-M17]
MHRLPLNTGRAQSSRRQEFLDSSPNKIDRNLRIGGKLRHVPLEIIHRRPTERSQGDYIATGIQVGKDTHLEVPVDPNQQFMIGESGGHGISLQRMDLSQVLVDRATQE